MAHAHVNPLHVVWVVLARVEVVHRPRSGIVAASGDEFGLWAVSGHHGRVGSGVDDKVGTVAGLDGEVETRVHFSAHRQQAAVRSLQVQILRAGQIEVGRCEVNRGYGFETEEATIEEEKPKAKAGFETVGADEF